MQRRIFLLKNSAWNNLLIAELMDFPAVDHDDQVDAFSLIGRQFTSIPTPNQDQAKSVKLEFFIEERDGVQMTSVPLEKLYDENKGISLVRRGRI